MKNTFVETLNAKNFITAMREAERMPGEPIILAFHGPAGRGKTNTCRYYAAQEGWTYCRCGKGWQKSELWMLQDLCFELRIDPIPGRKKAAFDAIVGRLSENPRAVVIDEADKMPDGHLEWVRDFVDLTSAPFALVGEKLLKVKMDREKRIWSRTLRVVEFEPITAKDILFFAKEVTEEKDGNGKVTTPGLRLSGNQADMMSRSAQGDFRPVKRQVFFVEELCRVNNTKTVTDEMIKVAIKKEQKERVHGS